MCLGGPVWGQDPFSRANQLAASGDAAGARALYEEWLAGHPEDAFARYNLSLVLEPRAAQGELARRFLRFSHPGGKAAGL